MAMKKPMKKSAKKPRAKDLQEEGTSPQDRRSYYAAKASKSANSPSASTRTRSAAKRPNALRQPMSSDSNNSSARGGMYPIGKKKVTKGSKY